MSIPNLLSLNFLLPAVAHKIDFSKAVRGLRGMPRRVLLVGHKLTAGSLLAATITTVASEADAVALCGEGSMLLAMYRTARENADRGLPIDIVHLAPNGTGVAATSTIAITNSGGTIQQVGEVMLYIEGKRIAVGVTTADTISTVATKLVAAINLVTSLGVTAATTATPGEVKLTCRWVGLTGNDIDVRNTYYDTDVLPTGLTLTIPAMSGGTTSPDLATLVAAMGDYRATEIVNAFTDATNMNLLEVELAKRWSHNNMTDGQAVVALRHADLAAALAWLGGRNSEQVHSLHTIKDATSPWVTAAAAGARIESAAVIDPASPHTDIVLSGYLGPRRGEHWGGDTANTIMLAGGSVLQVMEDRTGALWRMVTNYTQNSVNAPDISRRELCWVKTMSYYRWFTITEYQKYRGFKLAEYIEDPIPGQKIMTLELVEEIQIGIYTELSKVALVQNIAHYKDTLVVEIDGPNSKVKVQDEPVLVTQHYQSEITSYPIAGHV